MNLETINDFHCVFIRVYKQFINRQDLRPSASAFKNTPETGDNLSCDWCKYCSAQTSRDLIAKQKKNNGVFKNPFEFNIWRFNIRKLRNEISPKQEVIYEPVLEDISDKNIVKNIAHSIIIGQKPNNAEFRVQLIKIGNWAIYD